MICTEQERDALMAAVVEYGIAREDSGYYRGMAGHYPAPSDSHSRAVKAESLAGERYAAIRAMLAPDDAVAIPRALAERAIEAFRAESRSYYNHGFDDQAKYSDSGAEALLAVLRGEATR